MDAAIFAEVMMEDMTNTQIDVRFCVCCGQDHNGLVVRTLSNAPDVFTYYTTCPTTGQPIIVKFVEQWNAS